MNPPGRPWASYATTFCAQTRPFSGTFRVEPSASRFFYTGSTPHREPHPRARNVELVTVRN